MFTKTALRLKKDTAKSELKISSHTSIEKLTISSTTKTNQQNVYKEKACRKKPKMKVLKIKRKKQKTASKHPQT